MRELQFLSEAFEVEDIQKALYKYSDRLAGSIRRQNAEGIDYLVVTLRLSNDADVDFETLAFDIEIEVQDQALRRKIKADTEAARNLILAHTFSHLSNSSG